MYTPVQTEEDLAGRLEREASMMYHHIPSKIMFRNLSYLIPHSSGLSGHNENSPSGDYVLKNVQGMVVPGQCMAIMGGSGAGKSVIPFINHEDASRYSS